MLHAWWLLSCSITSSMTHVLWPKCFAKLSPFLSKLIQALQFIYKHSQNSITHTQIMHRKHKKARNHVDKWLTKMINQLHIHCTIIQHPKNTNYHVGNWLTKMANRSHLQNLTTPVPIQLMNQFHNNSFPNSNPLISLLTNNYVSIIHFNQIPNLSLISNFI